MQHNKLSRRHFLRLSGLVTAGAAIAACAPTAAPGTSGEGGEAPAAETPGAFLLGTPTLHRSTKRILRRVAHDGC